MNQQKFYEKDIYTYFVLIAPACGHLTLLSLQLFALEHRHLEIRMLYQYLLHGWLGTMIDRCWYHNQHVA